MKKQIISIITVDKPLEAAGALVAMLVFLLTQTEAMSQLRPDRLVTFLSWMLSGAVYVGICTIWHIVKRASHRF